MRLGDTGGTARRLRLRARSGERRQAPLRLPAPPVRQSGDDCVRLAWRRQERFVTLEGQQFVPGDRCAR